MGLVCPSDWESQERQGALRQDGHLAELGEILLETQHLICEMIYSGNKRLMLLTFPLLWYKARFTVSMRILSFKIFGFQLCLRCRPCKGLTFELLPSACTWWSLSGNFLLGNLRLPSTIPPFGKLAQPTGCQCWAWGASQTWVCSSLGS